MDKVMPIWQQLIEGYGIDLEVQDLLAEGDRAAARCRISSIRAGSPTAWWRSCGAPGLVRVRSQHIFPNCPRYIRRMQILETSPYVPAAGVMPPIPAWKTFPDFNDVLPRGDPARN